MPLASALFEGLAYNSEQVENYPDRYKSPRELELERRADAVLNDVVEELVTLQSARDIYGVVISADAVDETATRARRAYLRARRGSQTT